MANLFNNFCNETKNKFMAFNFKDSHYNYLIISKEILIGLGYRYKSD